jgi:hypothetical protein
MTWGHTITFTVYLPGSEPSEDDLFRVCEEIDALLGCEDGMIGVGGPSPLEDEPAEMGA